MTTDNASEYGRLLAERDRLIADGADPAELEMPLRPRAPLPATDERQQAGLRSARRAFADAFMRHPTGRMNDAEVIAVLDALAVAQVPAQEERPVSIDPERLARAMEDVFPGWLEEAPGSAEAQTEMRSYAEQLVRAYDFLADSASPQVPAQELDVERRNAEAYELLRGGAFVAGPGGSRNWSHRHWQDAAVAFLADNAARRALAVEEHLGFRNPVTQCAECSGVEP